MNLNDLKKLVTGPVLINLDRIITPRLITLFYLGGLAAIALGSINHLFFSFRFGFGNGLWGILEIAIFGTLAFIVLRALCEIALVFFKSHEDIVAGHNQNRRLAPAPTLIEDVREAIEDLAQDDMPVLTETTPPKANPTSKSASTRSASAKTSTATPATKRTAPRRTAKRAPRTTKSRSAK